MLGRRNCCNPLPNDAYRNGYIASRTKFVDLLLYYQDGELLHIYSAARPARFGGGQLAALQGREGQALPIGGEVTGVAGGGGIDSPENSNPDHHSQPTRPYYSRHSAEWDDQMPFPIIDRSRYWAYAGGISSLLVPPQPLSSSTPITTTPSQPTSGTAPSATSSPSSSPTSSPMPMPHTASRSSRSTCLMSTATSARRNL